MCLWLLSRQRHYLRLQCETVRSLVTNGLLLLWTAMSRPSFVVCFALCVTWSDVTMFRRREENPSSRTRVRHQLKKQVRVRAHMVDVSLHANRTSAWILWEDKKTKKNTPLNSQKQFSSMSGRIFPHKPTKKLLKKVNKNIYQNFQSTFWTLRVSALKVENSVIPSLRMCHWVFVAVSLQFPDVR